VLRSLRCRIVIWRTGGLPYAAGSIPNRDSRTSLNRNKESRMSQSLKKKRARAYESQAGKCYYCGIQMWPKNPQQSRAVSNQSSKYLMRIRCTAEHIQARSDGGSNATENIVAACWFCNQARHRRKKPKSPSVFAEFVRSRVRLGKWHPAQYQELY
jgi:hypothetical protein